MVAGMTEDEQETKLTFDPQGLEGYAQWLRNNRTNLLLMLSGKKATEPWVKGEGKEKGNDS